MVKEEKAKGGGGGSWWAGIKILQFKIVLIKLKMKTKACYHVLLRCIFKKRRKVLLIALFLHPGIDSNSSVAETNEQ